MPRTSRTNLVAEVDFVHSRIDVAGDSYFFQPVGRVVQDIVACGGMEAWVNAHASSA